jgi:F-type H+-transporting ATPase subunit epsilon
MAQTEAIGGDLTLQIVTPDKMVIDTRVAIVSLPGTEGDFGALAGHMPFVTLLQPGVVDYEEGGMPRKMAISGGVVEVTPNKVLVLARTCEKSDEIDVDRANKAKESSEAALEGMTHDHDDFDRMELKLKRAMSRIGAKG